MNTRVLVLYYSSWGHVETMAEAVAEGVRGAGAEAILKRVPELVPESVARKAGYKLPQNVPVANVSELADYDAIILACPDSIIKKFGISRFFETERCELRKFDVAAPATAQANILLCVIIKFV